MCGVYEFFFFKQKTAYEMRISDWSSDVCSSDLRAFRRCVEIRGDDDLGRPVRARPCDRPRLVHHHRQRYDPATQQDHGRTAARQGTRSEEHTSELQSLMRISYAVFCLKNKH